MRRQASAASCSEVNIVAIQLTTLVIQFPGAPDILVFSSMIIASSAVVCTDDEKTALAAVDEAFEEAVDLLDSALEAAQSQLLTLTGVTASPAEIAEVVAATTAAPAETPAPPPAETPAPPPAETPAPPPAETTAPSETPVPLDTTGPTDTTTGLTPGPTDITSVPTNTSSGPTDTTSGTDETHKS